MTDYPVSGKVLEENPEEGSRELFKETFEPDGTEGILAILVFILGFIFVRWILFNWRGWSVTFFTACYLG
ncbi:MAG TPA: hypothetical protein GX697_02230, partial [Firmicutes bacterium]|nr:hypothetical protein [Bacillota bacterium]